MENVKSKITYHQEGDYLIPNLIIKTNSFDNKINKFGLLRLQFIKTNKKAFYTSLLAKDELNSHLISVSKICEKRYEIMINNFIKNDEKLSEKSKNSNQLEWVKLMNNYKKTTEEIIKKEIIYV